MHVHCCSIVLKLFWGEKVVVFAYVLMKHELSNQNIEYFCVEIRSLGDALQEPYREISSEIVLFAFALRFAWMQKWRF